MNRIDRSKFFDGYRGAFGHLLQRQVDGLEHILALMEMDHRVTDVRHAAYMLATTKHETADTFQPVAEYGRGHGKPYGEPDSTTGHTYYGRGYVQLTWKENYLTQGRLLGIDLCHYPEEALKPPVAYEIMSQGMRLGMFTGAGLHRFIHAAACDYRNARKIINGLDCADRIARFAVAFESILKNAAAAA